MADDPFRERLEGLGAFIREQRHQAQLTLRELADRANVSNPYLSQIERGLHEPSVRVLSSIATALDLSAESLLSLLGLSSDEDRPETEQAIRTDPRLSEDQRASLLAVYRSYVGSTGDDGGATSGENDPSGPTEGPARGTQDEGGSSQG